MVRKRKLQSKETGVVLTLRQLIIRLTTKRKTEQNKKTCNRKKTKTRKWKRKEETEKGR